MPKKKKKPRNKELQESNELLWKQVIEARDGRRCMVKLLFPEIAVGHTEIYQADHCFTRANKHLFYEPANGTMVCSGCNMAKHYDNKSVKRAVDIIVIGREGEEKFQEMMSIDMRKSANVNWNKVWWLEEQEVILNKKLKEIQKEIPGVPGVVEIVKVEEEEKDEEVGDLFNER